MHVNNICFCKCHQLGKSQCMKCKNLHLAKEKPVTDKNDKSNPTYKEDK